jgi:hypothetical protein
MSVRPSPRLGVSKHSCTATDLFLFQLDGEVDLGEVGDDDDEEELHFPLICMALFLNKFVCVLDFKT